MAPDVSRGACNLMSKGTVEDRVTLLVMAGGKSRRMGRDKLLLPVPPKGVPLVLHVVERLLPIADHAFVLANDAKICAALRRRGTCGSNLEMESARSRVRVDCIADDKSNQGPLGGLATGLRRVEGWALAVAGDMPLVSPNVCRHLIELADDDCDAVVAAVNGRVQPLHALYHRRCLPAVESSLAAGALRMDSFLGDIRVRAIEGETVRPLDPDLQSFFNANTPTEWDEAVALLSRG